MSTDFNIELVPAKNPALHSIAEINPFDDKDANWEEREAQMIQLRLRLRVRHSMKRNS